MVCVRADPPQVHRREVHRRGQFAPDLAARIKLALLHLREYRAADTRLSGKLALREPQTFPMVEHHPGQRARFVVGTAGLARLPTEDALCVPPRCLRRISHAHAPFCSATFPEQLDFLLRHAMTALPLVHAQGSRRNVARAMSLFYRIGPPMDNFL